MNKKDLSIPFNTPLNPQDTELQTYGCRANNPHICGNNGLPDICAFFQRIVFVKNQKELGKNNKTSSKAKPLNYCLFYY